jgi:hypothetical protein
MGDQDHGVLSEVTINNSITSSCDKASSMDWTFTGGISSVEGDTSDEEKYDEIEQYGSKIWKFFGHFESVPKNLVKDNCPNEDLTAFPDSFEYTVQPDEDENIGDVYLNKPQPREDTTDSSNPELYLALDLIAGLSGTYTSIGAAMFKYFIRDGDSVTVDEPDRSTYVIDVPHETDRDLQQEKDGEANVAEVSLRVNNETEVGTSHLIDFHPSYTFGYPKTYEKDCFCDTTVTEYKTTAPDFVATGQYETI